MSSDPLSSCYFAYHIYARSSHSFHLTQFLFQRVVARLQVLCAIHGIYIHAFVLMSNHYHLLLSSPQGTVGELLSELKSMSALKTLSELKSMSELEPLWEEIRHPVQYAEVYKYIYQNPVKAGLCFRVEKYPYSSWSLGLIRRHPRGLDHLVPANPILHLKWLNNVRTPFSLSAKAINSTWCMEN